MSRAKKKQQSRAPRGHPFATLSSDDTPDQIADAFLYVLEEESSWELFVDENRNLYMRLRFPRSAPLIARPSLQPADYLEITRRVLKFFEWVSAYDRKLDRVVPASDVRRFGSEPLLSAVTRAVIARARRFSVDGK